MIKVSIESGFPSIKESGGEVGVHDFLGGGELIAHISHREGASSSMDTCMRKCCNWS